MTQTDLMTLLNQKIDETSQANVARLLNISDSALSQLRSGSYKASPDAILQRVREVFGDETVHCPILKEISLRRCAEKRKLPFAATNPQRVALYRACQTCPQNGGKS
jgi:transcriptional regulator with XRE-family HTH domain